MNRADDPTPSWARHAQTRRGALTPQVQLFDSLNAAWKAREAVGAGVLTAVSLGLLNLMTGAIQWGGRYPPVTTVAMRAGVSMPFLQLVAALVLLWIAARLHRTRSVLLSWIVLAWAVADVTMLSLHLYGHGPMRAVSGFLVLLALLGVRGAMRLRRLAADGAA